MLPPEPDSPLGRTRSTSDVSLKSRGSARRPPISFKDESIRRGTRACDVLRNMGAIWQDCKGSTETYSLSAPVSGLNVFISHNWSTPRLSKFCALTLYFNFAKAVGAGVVAATVLAILVALDYLPLMHHWGFYTFTAPYATVAAYICPGVMLLCGHEVVGRLECLRSCDYSVFLDKTCIHQTNKDLQRRGLENLTAFLNASDEILVVYSDTYLQRLWTVYELVSVIVIKQAPLIRVLPADFSFLVNLWWFGFFIVSVLYLLMYSEEVQESTREDVIVDAMLMGSLSPLLLLLMCHLRQFAKQRSRMFAAVRNFNIHAAECTVAADRRTVYRNVSILMRDFGFVPVQASDDEAVNSFNALARGLIPPHLDASFGLIGIPYRHIVLMSSPLLAVGVDQVAANVRFHQGARWLLAEATWYVSEGTIVIPLWLALCCWLTSLRLQLKRPQEVLFVGMLWPAMLILYWGMRQFTIWLYTLGAGSWAGYAVEAGVLSLAALFVSVIYRPRRVRPHVQEQWKEQQRTLSEKDGLYKGEAAGEKDGTASGSLGCTSWASTVISV